MAIWQTLLPVAIHLQLQLICNLHIKQQFFFSKFISEKKNIKWHHININYEYNFFQMKYISCAMWHSETRKNEKKRICWKINKKKSFCHRNIVQNQSIPNTHVCKIQKKQNNRKRNSFVGTCFFFVYWL